MFPKWRQRAPLGRRASIALRATIAMVAAALALLPAGMQNSGWAPAHVEHNVLYYAPFGLFVGFVVGMTGIGGALLTPSLIWAYGLKSNMAVVIDFLFSTFTKAFGSREHFRHGHVDGKVAFWMARGSVPATLATTLVVGHKSANMVVTLALGVTLIVVAGIFACEGWIKRKGEAWHQLSIGGWWWTAIGAVVGFIVGLTSVGSGSLVFVALALLRPGMSKAKIVGTDTFQSMLMLVAGSAGYLLTGAIHGDAVGIAGGLLVGSFPGVTLGAWATKRLAHYLKWPLAGAVALSGILLLIKLL